MFIFNQGQCIGFKEGVRPLKWSFGLSQYKQYPAKGEHFILLHPQLFTFQHVQLAGSLKIPAVETRLGDAEKGKIHSLLLRHAVADALGRVPHHLCGRGGAVAVDGLRPAGLGCVGGVLGGREAKDVGPLLELLLV